MTQTAKNRISSALVLGLLLVAFGSLQLLEGFRIISGNLFWKYWPLVLIAAGIVKMASQQGSSRFWGLVLLVGGILLQLSKLGMGVRFGLWDLWPLLILFIGLKLVWDALTQQEGARADNVSSTSLLNDCAFFGGVQKQINARDFRGGELTAVFGGIDIDLRNADLAESEAVVRANAVFGGVEIKVPPTWSVVADGVGLFGGYGDETQQPKIEDTSLMKRLVVKGVAVFGAVEIKN